MSRSLLPILVAGMLAAQGLASQPAVITVRADRILGPVNRLVFGHNLEAADSKDIFGTHANPVPGRTGDGAWDPAAARPVPEFVTFANEIGIPVLRYPGGCLTHNFDWKETVGPVGDRPDFAFGLDEFMTLCQSTGAEPLITVSAYVGGPRDAADLVEYLNGPADSQHPWARKRATGGHPKPYGVKFFEMANEADHGNHQVKPFRKFTPQEYAAWVNDCAARMRKVDPGIQIGAHMGTGTGPGDPWNETVLKKAGDVIDFVVVHTYAVGLWGPPQQQSADLLMRACMAAGEQIEDRLMRYRELVRSTTGRNLPLAITEYNASFVQQDPVPYRFSLGPALFSADYLRILLKPQNRILMANYWHLVNGYWGMLQGPRDPSKDSTPWKTMAAYPLFRLWGQHFGERLVEVSVESDRLEFEGCLGVRSCAHEPGAQLETPQLNLSPGSEKDHRWTVKDGNNLTLHLKNFKGEAYPIVAKIDVAPGKTYALSFTGRLTGEVPPDFRAGLGFVDQRGWENTRSGNAVEGLRNAPDWQPFSGELTTLPDCPGLYLLWRLRAKHTPVSATIEIRRLKVRPIAPFPAYPVITSCGSLSADGKTLYLVVFNKHHVDAQRVVVNIRGLKAQAGRIWTVTGPSLEATNRDEELIHETQSGTPLDGVTPAGLSYTFPARSMSAIELAGTAP